MRNFHFPGRSLVYGRRAMCATSHPPASLTAIETLKQGGNAVDAAIATAAVLAVVEPQMTGIGGDCFALVAKPGRRSRSPSTPRAARPRRRPRSGSPSSASSASRTRSPHAVTVPGAIDGWTRLLDDHGTMPLERAAGAGHRAMPSAASSSPRAWRPTGRCTRGASRGTPAPRSTCFKQGEVPRGGRGHALPGAWRAPSSASPSEGRDGFYAGEVAKDMVAELKALGGLHTLDDFAAQTLRATSTPISVPYRGVELYELPPSNQGIVALICCRCWRRSASCRKDPVSVERYHVQIEAARLAFAMRDAFVADPDMADVPVEHMLSDAVIDDLAARVDRKKRRARARRLAAARRLRHRLFLHRRREGHGGLVHQLALRRLRLRHRHRQDRRRSAQPRQGLRARSRASQLHRAGQAADAHAGAGHGAEGRQAPHGRSA